MLKKICLDGNNWLLKETEKSELLKASVPGCVHLDLLKSNKIPDPFFGVNESKLQWINEKDWAYQKKFDVSDKELLTKEKIELVFNGIDTFAIIILNRKKLSETQNMFCEYRFNVKNILKERNNRLEVIIKSPTKKVKSLEKKYGKLFTPFDPSCTYARKSQYSFGWDWGPRFPTSGIYKSVEISGYDTAKIKSVFANVKEINNANTRTNIEYEIESLKETTVEVNLNISFLGLVVITKKKTLKIKQGCNSGYIPVVLDNPQLWFPNGYGKQNLYDISVVLKKENSVLDKKTNRFGIRKVRILQNKDAEGKTFIFEINNIKIFCKGCNWIPTDSFIPRITNNNYKRLISYVKDGYMNMLRVWGGGLYENDYFYKLCDELGIMVWQDFMFACGSYPDKKWFLDLVKPEFEYQIRRLRNHPSIVLWCGNNENEGLRWGNWDCIPSKNGKVQGDIIFYKVLPEMCKKLDPVRPYWPSSPFGDEKEYNSQPTGDRHSWSEDYTKDKGRFISEFGFQSMPSLRTINSFTKQKERIITSETMENHNKLLHGMEKLYPCLSNKYPVPDNFTDFVYLTQIVQGEELKCGIEHWRRRKFKTAGALIWQLNDCWPVTSWSLIDYYLVPKISYFYVKKAFAPVLVSIERKKNNISIWITNDLLEDISGELTIRIKSLVNGRKIYYEKKIKVSVGRNLSNKIVSVDLKEMGIDYKVERLGIVQTITYSTDDVNDKYIFVSLKVNEKEYTNTCLIKPIKYLNVSLQKIIREFMKINTEIVPNSYACKNRLFS